MNTKLFSVLVFALAIASAYAKAKYGLGFSGGR
jgi:hypothetical protein